MSEGDRTVEVRMEIPGLKDFLDRWVEKKKHSFRPGQVIDTDALTEELRQAVEEYVAVNKIFTTHPVPRTVVHHIADGSGKTTCCMKTPFELPMDDKISSDPMETTCREVMGDGPLHRD